MAQSYSDHETTGHHRHHSHHHHRHHHRTPRKLEKRPRKIWPIVLAIVLILLVGGGAYGFALYRSAMNVKDNAQTAVDLVSEYAAAAKEGDAGKLQEVASQTSAAAHTVQGELSSKLWSVAQRIPVVGSDVHSVRVMSDVLVDVADNALTPLAQNTDTLKLSTLMANSEVNIDALNALLGIVEQVRPVVARSAEATRDLPRAHIGQVESILAKAREGLGGASDALDQLSPLLPYLSTMLGGDGQTKTYMVLAQDTGEVHATGGFVGWIGYLDINNGHIELRDFEALTKVLGGTDDAGATAEEMELFDAVVGTHTGDHNMTPDFSRAGQMYHDTNLTIKNEDVYGVIAVDPVFLQYMLGLVGPIETSFDVTVDGSNAASVTLNRCLFWWPGAKCDEFYSEVSNAAFSKVLNGLGSVDTMDFLKVLSQEAAEYHCMAWMRDAELEAAVQAAGFGGELDHDPTRPVTGVYLNDRTTSKVAYYLSVDTQVVPEAQSEDGTSAYVVQLKIKNNMSRAVLAEGLPGYLTVHRDDGRSVADLYEDLFLMAPEGGSIEFLSATRMNSVEATSEIAFGKKSYQGLQTLKGVLRLDADEVIVISYRVTTSPEATEPLTVRVTPLVPEEIAYWNEK